MKEENMHKGKILFIATVESHILYFHVPFLKYFQEKGYEVHVATKLGRRSDELEKESILCHEVSFSRSPYSLATIKALRQLLQIMRDSNFSLVHVHTPMGAFLGRLAAKLTNTKPVLYTAHGFHFYKGAPIKNWLIYYSMERVAAHWTDGIVTMNEEDYQFARKFKLRQDNAVFIVPGVGLPVEKYEISDANIGNKKLRQQMGYGDEDTLLLTVAEFISGKNHIQTIKAMQEVVKHKKNVHLLIAGEGKLEGKLKKMVIRFGLQENINFLGYRKDIPALLCLIDIFISTSRREGLPRSIMEAMAAGKPIVATDVRGNRDLVQDDVNGYLVPLNDTGKTVEALLKLVNDKELATKMGGKGREIIKNYSIEKVLHEMEHVYRKFLS